LWPVIKENIGGSVSIFHYDNEATITSGFSAVTCKVFYPGGAELIASTSLSASVIASADGEMSITIDAALADAVDEYYRAHFQYTHDSIVFTKDAYFHIAPTDFDINFHFADLQGIAPEIGDYTFTGDSYFYRQREIAIAILYDRLLNAGYKPWQIINRDSLEVPFGYLWMSHVCRALSKGRDDDYLKAAAHFAELYEEAFGRVNLLESTDADVAAQQPQPRERTWLRRG